MECSKINLSAYLDNELSQEEKQKVSEHLKNCKNCVEEIKVLSKLNNLVNKQKEIEPSSNFNMKFWERVRKDEDKKKAGLFWLPLPATAILLFIILFQLTNFSYALLNNKDFEVKNIVLQRVKETVFCSSISNISCLINLCDRCIHNLCKCKEIECNCKQCKIKGRHKK